MFKKITPKQYAIALYDVLSGVEKDKVDFFLKNFLKTLEKNNDLVLLDKILKEFEKTYNEKKGILKVKVVSAFDLDKEALEEIKEKIKNLLKKKEVVLETEIDKSILGGLVLKYEDTVVDGSLKRRLALLKNVLSK